MCSPARDGGSLHRVSPFGYRRISARTRLPDAFRSVPRPSSALDAQASPVRLVWLGLSCGDRALPLSEKPSQVSLKGAPGVLKENSESSPLGVMYTHTIRDLFLYAFCALSIQLLRYRVPGTAYRVEKSLLVPRYSSLVTPVGLSGLEPLTSPLSEECSNQLSYRPVCGLSVSSSVFQFLSWFTKSLVYWSPLTSTQTAG